MDEQDRYGNQASRDEAYQEGYNAGEEAGQAEGYDSGLDIGYDEGYNDGFEEGCVALGEQLVDDETIEDFDCVALLP